MTEPDPAETAVAICSPARGLWPLLFARSDIGLLALGDTALADPIGRAGLAAYARSARMEAVWLWGRAAQHHRDVIAEQWASAADAPTAPILRAVWSFEPVDLISAAEAIAAAAEDAQPRRAMALFDLADPLEARLRRELGDWANLIATPH